MTNDVKGFNNSLNDKFFDLVNQNLSKKIRKINLTRRNMRSHNADRRCELFNQKGSWGNFIGWRQSLIDKEEQKGDKPEDHESGKLKSKRALKKLRKKNIINTKVIVEEVNEDEYLEKILMENANQIEVNSI